MENNLGSLHIGTTVAQAHPNSLMEQSHENRVEQNGFKLPKVNKKEIYYRVTMNVIVVVNT